jgi:hypothetical protein
MSSVGAFMVTGSRAAAENNNALINDSTMIAA